MKYDRVLSLLSEKEYRNIMRLLFTLSFLPLLFACTTIKKPILNMANPASVYCESIGGKLQLEDQSGFCYFSDGKVIEEWELYRRDHP